MTLTIGSLCSGYGGLEIGVSEVLDAKPAWFAENDPAASKVLAYRFPGMPNLGDLTQVNWDRVRETHGTRKEVMPTSAPAIDIVTAGWP